MPLLELVEVVDSFKILALGVDLCVLVGAKVAYNDFAFVEELETLFDDAYIASFREGLAEIACRQSSHLDLPLLMWRSTMDGDEYARGRRSHLDLDLELRTAAKADLDLGLI